MSSEKFSDMSSEELSKELSKIHPNIFPDLSFKFIHNEVEWQDYLNEKYTHKRP